MQNSNNATNGGIGFCGVLFIVFLILKLTNHIEWSWWWITLPLWWWIALIIAGVLLFTIFWIFSIFVRTIFKRK